MNNNESILLTITSCRRYDLFYKTIVSFIENCTDIHLIKNIIHYDDSSSYEDRIKMNDILYSSFPNAEIINVNFERDSFSTDRRHLEIMKIWKSDISNFEYVFHLEDDWLFVDKFSLYEGIELLKNNNGVGSVGFSWEKKDFPRELFIPQEIGNFWEWYYSEKHELNEPLFLDVVEMKYLPDGFWVKYINWPYFGFRPAIHDIKKINTLDNFNDSMTSFELEFAIRYSKKYKSFLHNKRICYHIGDNVSSYNLNSSLR
jgi:hypothetical protein